jgi:Reduced folate carrier
MIDTRWWLALFALSLAAYFKPAEPFLVDYLTRVKGVAESTVIHGILPLWTYAQFLFVLLYGIVAEYFAGCKWLLVLGFACLAAEALVIVLASTLPLFQLDEFLSASGIAAMSLLVPYALHLLGAQQKRTELMPISYVNLDRNEHDIALRQHRGTDDINGMSDDGIAAKSGPLTVNDEERRMSDDHTVCDVFAIDGDDAQQSSMSVSDSDAVKKRMSVLTTRRFLVTRFQSVASLCRSAFLMGTVSSSLLGQLLVDADGIGVVSALYWIAFGVMCAAALLTATAFPNVLHCKFAAANAADEAGVERRRRRAPPRSFVNRFKALLGAAGAELVRLYSGPMRMLSLWQAVSLAVHALALTYYQSLFRDIDATRNYNGYVSTLSYLLAAIGAAVPSVCASAIRLDMFVVAVPVAGASLLAALALVDDLYGAYALFVCYHVLFEFSIAFVIGQVAVHIAPTTNSGGSRVRRFALVFSLNRLVGLAIQSLLQLALNALSDVSLYYMMLADTLLALALFSLVELLYRLIFGGGDGNGDATI